MESSFKYGPISLFLHNFWVTLPSDQDGSLLLSPLTHREVTALAETSYIVDKDSTYSQEDTQYEILAKHIIDSRGCIGFPSISLLLQQLPKTDIQFLLHELYNISSVSTMQNDKISDMLDIQFNSAFQDDSWECSKCQAKGLDYSRGCPYLDPGKRDPLPLLPRVDGKRPKTCPIAEVEGYVINQAQKAYTLLESGTLPESGGLGDQTEWFVKAAFLYRRKVNEAERAAHEDRKK